MLHNLHQVMTGRLGMTVTRTDSLYPWQTRTPRPGPLDDAALPPGTESKLRPDNPGLCELQRRYAAFDLAVTTPAVWTNTQLSARDLLYFRGDNAFVWQARRLNDNELTAALCYYALKADDAEGLLGRLGEDYLFGAHAFSVDGRLVSRDLLDSAREIQFLIRRAGLGERTRTVLDIGAGYGRLAWRLDQAMGERVRVFATDAFAASTFLCDHYLKFRGAKQAAAVPLDEVEALLARESIDIAANIHSFSECTREAVAWWAERLARHRVRHLLIVPNEGTSGGARCQLRDGTDFEPVLAHYGYRAVVREPRYPDSFVQGYGLDPVQLHLFALGGTANAPGCA
jgi:hypothetical protein